jgi:hypothetical protein
MDAVPALGVRARAAFALAFAFAVATRPIHASTASAVATDTTRAKMDVHGDARKRVTRFDGLMK